MFLAKKWTLLRVFITVTNLLLALTIASGYAGDKPLIRSGIKNTTGLTISKGIGKFPWSDAHRCTGHLTGSDVILKEIGITADEIKAGVPCIAGDFDGNGYLDVAFFPKADVEHLARISHQV